MYAAAAVGREFYPHPLAAPGGYGSAASQHHSFFRYMSGQPQIKQEHTCLWIEKVSLSYTHKVPYSSTLIFAIFAS